MRARRTVSIAAVAATAAVLLVGTVTSSAQADTNCGAALLALANAQNHENDVTAPALDQAQKNDAAARDKQQTAVTLAQTVFHTWEINHPTATQAQKDAVAAARDAAIKNANDAYTTGGTAQKLVDAQTAETAAQRDVNSKSSTADTACKGGTGAPGTPGVAGSPGATGPQGNPGLPGSNGAPGAVGSQGANGKDGTNGKDGIDARIVLAPGVCANAEVQPGSVQRLIRVVAIIPCPVVAPPATGANPGQSVTTIPATSSVAGQPPAAGDTTVVTHLPVTG